MPFGVFRHLGEVVMSDSAYVVIDDVLLVSCCTTCKYMYWSSSDVWSVHRLSIDIDISIYMSLLQWLVSCKIDHQSLIRHSPNHRDVISMRWSGPVSAVYCGPHCAFLSQKWNTPLITVHTKSNCLVAMATGNYLVRDLDSDGVQCWQFCVCRQNGTIDISNQLLMIFNCKSFPCFRICTVFLLIDAQLKSATSWGYP